MAGRLEGFNRINAFGGRVLAVCRVQGLHCKGRTDIAKIANKFFICCEESIKTAFAVERSEAKPQHILV